MSPRGKEKRGHQRVSGRITMRTISSDDYGTIEMETANLSPGGAYCLSSQSIPPMTRLRLNIFLPSNDGRPAKLHYPIQVDAVVVRSEPLNGDGADGGESEAAGTAAAAATGKRAPDASTGAASQEKGAVADGSMSAGAAEDGATTDGAPDPDGSAAYRLALFFADIADKDRQLISRYLGTTAES